MAMTGQIIIANYTGMLFNTKLFQNKAGWVQHVDLNKVWFIVSLSFKSLTTELYIAV